MGGKLIHEGLSYRIRGIFYLVHNTVGQYSNEKQYCDAIEHFLLAQNVLCQREKVLDPSFQGEYKGRNRIDFVVNNQVVIEVKAVNCLTKDHYYQCLRYLVASGLELAFLVNFRNSVCTIKRIPNPNFLKKDP